MGRMRAGVVFRVSAMSCRRPGLNWCEQLYQQNCGILHALAFSICFADPPSMFFCLRRGFGRGFTT